MSKIIGNTTATTMPLPDWNQNSSVKADYIKNRPFYEGATAIEIFPDTTFEFSHISGVAHIGRMDGMLDTPLVDGVEYHLKIDDVVYTSICRTFEGRAQYLGNIYLCYTAYESTGESFCFFADGTNLVCVTTEFGAGSHTVAISQPTIEIHTLDEKFIPDTIARVADIMTEEQIAAIEFITVNDIDEICGTAIEAATSEGTAF